MRDHVDGDHVSGDARARSIKIPAAPSLSWCARHPARVADALSASRCSRTPSRSFSDPVSAPLPSAGDLAPRRVRMRTARPPVRSRLAAAGPRRPPSWWTPPPSSRACDLGLPRSSYVGRRPVGVTGALVAQSHLQLSHPRGGDAFGRCDDELAGCRLGRAVLAVPYVTRSPRVPHRRGMLPRGRSGSGPRLGSSIASCWRCAFTSGDSPPSDRRTEISPAACTANRSRAGALPSCAARAPGRGASFVGVPDAIARLRATGGDAFIAFFVDILRLRNILTFFD